MKTGGYLLVAMLVVFVFCQCGCHLMQKEEKKPKTVEEYLFNNKKVAEGRYSY